MASGRLKVAILQLYPTKLARQWPTTPPADLEDMAFQFDDATGADYVILLNGVKKRTVVHCAPERVWALVQEPPTPEEAHIYRGQKACHRVYLPMDPVTGPGRISFFGGLDWQIGRTYDELEAAPYPEKTVELAWVTSNLRYLDGHKVRMKFLEGLQASGIPLDLWGRGIRPLEVKWDVLAPARYAIAFENFGGGAYWSEKIMDCFLAYATPFYYGASNIERYFPPKSFIRLNPDDPHVYERMRDAIDAGYHKEHMSALLEARELCLRKYNTLFYIAREILADEVPPSPPRSIALRKVGHPPETPWQWVNRVVRDLLRPLIPSPVLARYRLWRDSRT